MTIFEIDNQIRALLEAAEVNEETGEWLIDEQAIEELNIAREEKIESICMYYKELSAEAVAIKAEEDKLKKRRESVGKKAEKIEKLISYALNGEKFKTAKVEVKCTTTQKVETNPEFIEWAMQQDRFLRYKLPEVDKVELKKALKANEPIPYAALVTSMSMTIK